MVEPEMAENTVPATTATTASRPGTWQTRRSMPSITFSASPVWKRISPISTNSGIGVSEKLITAAALLRSIWLSPASPPRNRIAPTMLIAMNENATGMPMKSNTVEPPSSSNAESCQDMCPTPRSCRGHRVVARPLLALRQAMHAKQELDAQQREGKRHWRKQPPFRHDQRLDRERAAREARRHHAQAIPDEIAAADDAQEVAEPFEQPADFSRQRAQHDVDADVLPMPQQCGRREQRDQVDDVLGDLVARRDAAHADIAKEHVGADQQGHHQQQQASDEQQRLEQATIPMGQSRHARYALLLQTSPPSFRGAPKARARNP